MTSCIIRPGALCVARTEVVAVNISFNEPEEKKIPGIRTPKTKPAREFYSIQPGEHFVILDMEPLTNSPDMMSCRCLIEGEIFFVTGHPEYDLPQWFSVEA